MNWNPDTTGENTMRKIGILLTFLFVLTVADARADVVNGSFESATTPTAVPAGSFLNFVPGGTSLIPWL